MKTKDIKYPYLPEGRTIKYVDDANQFMVRAKEVAKTSNDQQQPTGAVIVYDNRVVAEVSNKNPLSSKRLVNLHKKYCIRHMFKIPSGQKYWMCPGCASHENHGEYRAVVALVKQHKNNLNNCDLYLWGHWWCCKPCWDKMISVGIRDVYLLDISETVFNLNNPNNVLGHQFDPVVDLGEAL